jgi:hypothetical protein
MAYGRLVVVVIAVSFPACGPSASSTGAGTFGIPDASGRCSGAYAASGGGGRKIAEAIALAVGAEEGASPSRVFGQS